MKENERELGEMLRRDVLERLQIRPLPPAERPTIPYTELPEARSDGPITAEWNFYRREVGRLLAEGHEGRWVLIKGEAIVGIWDTEAEGEQVRLQRFFMQPVLLKQICSREPVLRGGGYQYGWRRSSSVRCH